MKNIGKRRAAVPSAVAAGKRRAAAPSAAATMPRGTNADEDSGVSSLESSSSKEDDDDADASGDSDAELLGVVKPGAEQRAGLDDGAEKPPASENKEVVASPRAVVMNEWDAYTVAEVTEETVEHLGGPLAW
eukprot:jgi/Undpi1/9842/HiC_scaffold_27.g12296.m1